MSHRSKMLLAARRLRQNLSVDPGVEGPYQWGTIASITAGSTGVPATVGVYLDSASSVSGAVITTGIPFINGYYPTVGDVVLIARMSGAARTQRIVLGTLEGVLNGLNSVGGIFGSSATLSGPLVVPPSSGGTPAPTSYGSVPVKIAEQTLLAASNSITFSSIPQGFRHLVLEIVGRTNVAALNSEVGIRFNGDTTANYGWSRVSGGGNAAPSSAESGATLSTSMRFLFIPGGTSVASFPGILRYWIPLYAGTTFKKVIRGQDVTNIQATMNVANAMEIDIQGGTWNSTAAVTSLVAFATDGSSFIAGTYARLIGEP